MSFLEDYEGQEVKILYRDGEAVKTYHGVYKIDPDGIVIRFNDGTPMLINKNEILKVILRK